MTSPEAEAALTAALQDDDSWVRYVSATCLGRRGGRSIVRALAPLAAADPAPHVRAAAIEALGAVGGTEVAPLLAPLVDDADRDVANAATRALGKAGASSSGEPLRRVLESNDPARRAAAVDALIVCGGEPSVELLRWAAGSDRDKDVARAAAHGLAELAGRSDPSASAAISGLLELAADPSREAMALAALADLPADAIPLLESSLASPDVRHRRSGVAALARLPHPTSSALLRMALGDSDAGIREIAVQALSRVGARACCGHSERWRTATRRPPSGAQRWRQCGGTAGGAIPLGTLRTRNGYDAS